MKIIIDTNVLLSTLFSKKGASFKLIYWLLKKYKTNLQKISVVSTPLVIEYEAVLMREKNRKRYPNLSSQDIREFVDGICLISHHQKINFMWRPFLKDLQDDMVLEVAFNSGAKYIITYNIKDFKGVEENFDIKVITPKQFLQKIGEIK